MCKVRRRHGKSLLLLHFLGWPRYSALHSTCRSDGDSSPCCPCPPASGAARAREGREARAG